MDSRLERKKMLENGECTRDRIEQALVKVD